MIEPVARTPHYATRILDLAVASRETVLFVDDAGVVGVWSVSAQEVRELELDFERELFTVAALPGGGIVFGGVEGLGVVSAEGQLRAKVELPQVQAVAPLDGDNVLVASSDARLRWLRLSDGAVLHEVPVGERNHGIVPRPKDPGTFAVGASNQGGSRLLFVRAQAGLELLEQPRLTFSADELSRPAFDPTGALVAVASHDLEVFEVDGGRRLGGIGPRGASARGFLGERFLVEERWGPAVSFGNLIACASPRDGQVLLVDPSTVRRAGRIEVQAEAIASGGSTMVVATTDGQLQLFERS